MLKPELCPMHVECCEHCKEWEPIPFHNDGGVCLARREMSTHQGSSPGFGNKGANLVAIKKLVPPVPPQFASAEKRLAALITGGYRRGRYGGCQTPFALAAFLSGGNTSPARY